MKFPSGDMTGSETFPVKVSCFSMGRIGFLAVFLIKKSTLETPILPIEKQLTFTGNVSLPVISPDGNFIAYVNQETFDEQAIIVQDIVSEHAIEVYRVRYHYNLRWMPDSSEICVSGGLRFDYNSLIFSIPRLGGTPRKIPYLPFFTISPDGSQFAGYFENWKEIKILNKTTGDSNFIPLSGDFQSFIGIDWSPLGNLILFLTSDNEKYTIWTINTDGKNQQKVVEESTSLFSPRWSTEGDTIFYIRGDGLERELWSIPVSPDIGKPLKSSSLVLPATQGWGNSFSLASDGKKFVYARTLEYSNLWLTTLEGPGDSSALRTKSLTTGTLMNDMPSISPDGSQIAFSRGDGEKSNIYVMSIEGGSPTQITFMNSNIFSPAWSPDGKHIAFACKEEGVFNVWRVIVQGGKPFQFINSEISHSSPFVVWSPGANIIYQRPGNLNFHILNPETGEEAPLVQDESVGWIFNPKYSPDGKKVAVWWNRKENAEDGIWVISLDDSSSVLIKKGPFFPIGWSTDGKWVYSYETMGGTIRVLMVEIESRQERTVAEIPFAFEIGQLQLFGDKPCMSPDGKNFVIPIQKTNSDVWLIENFDEIIKYPYP